MSGGPGFRPETWRHRDSDIQAARITPETLAGIRGWMEEQGCHASTVWGPGHRHLEGIAFGSTLGSFVAEFGSWIVLRGPGQFEVLGDGWFRERYEQLPPIIICIDEVALMMREPTLRDAVRSLILLGRSERITAFSPRDSSYLPQRSWPELEEFAAGAGAQVWIGDVKAGPEEGNHAGA